MIVFSAKLIDHIPRWAICLLKGRPGPGKVERTQPRGSGHCQTEPAFQGAGGAGPTQGHGTGHGVTRLDREMGSPSAGNRART